MSTPSSRNEEPTHRVLRDLAFGGNPDDLLNWLALVKNLRAIRASTLELFNQTPNVGKTPNSGKNRRWLKLNISERITFLVKAQQVLEESYDSQASNRDVLSQILDADTSESTTLDIVDVKKVLAEMINELLDARKQLDGNISITYVYQKLIVKSIPEFEIFEEEE